MGMARNGILQWRTRLMRIWILIPALLLPSPALAQDKSGAIEGSVRYLGVVPPAQKIMTTDGGTIFHNDLVVEAKSKGLRFVAVYLEKAPEHKTPARKTRVTFDQRDMLFLPRVLAIQEGQTVRFENNDLCNHGVRANSAVMANTFNVNTPPGQPFDFEFKTQKHPVVLDCPIHGWMKAYVFAFDHPFFAISDEKGAYCIPHVPPGKYNIVFQHVDSATREIRPVAVEAGKTTALNVEWEKAGARK